MKCPKCSGTLKVKSLGGLQIDSCYVCEGIWFDAGELEEVIKKDSPHFDYIRVGKEHFDGAEASKANFDQTTGKCPRCVDTTHLVLRPYPQKESVNVDLCPRGHGVWLDGGEILKFGPPNYLQMLRGLFSREGMHSALAVKGKKP